MERLQSQGTSASTIKMGRCLRGFSWRQSLISQIHVSPWDTEMDKSSTEDKDNSLYTAQYETCPASSQPPAGAALVFASVDLRRHLQPQHRQWVHELWQEAEYWLCQGALLHRLLVNLFSTDRLLDRIASCPIKSLSIFFEGENNPQFLFFIQVMILRQLMFLLWCVRSCVAAKN